MTWVDEQATEEMITSMMRASHPRTRWEAAALVRDAIAQNIADGLLMAEQPTDGRLARYRYARDVAASAPTQIATKTEVRPGHENCMPYNCVGPGKTCQA